MPKQSQEILKDYDYQVITEPLFTKEGNETKYIVTRRVDNGRVLGSFKNQYGLVQNDTVINLAEEAFSKHNMNPSKRDISVARGGSRLYATYTFFDKTKEVVAKDDVALQLVVNNSFDGTSPVSFSLNLMRLVCKNGLLKVVSNEFSFSKKHVGEINFRGVDLALSKALGEFDNVISIFNKMANIKVANPQGIKLIENLVAKKIIPDKMGSNVASIWQSPRHELDFNKSLWSLYNSFTEHLTHEVQPERFEYAQNVGARITGVFQGLVKNTGNLEILLA